MGRKRNEPVSPETINNILKHKDEIPAIGKRVEFYKMLGEKYKVSLCVVQKIFNANKSYSEQYDRLWRRTLKFKVSTEQAENIITDMYKEIFNKNPEKVKCIHRYGTVQIFVKPENIIFQVDELLLLDTNKFVEAAYASMYNNIKVQDYLKELRQI